VRHVAPRIDPRRVLRARHFQVPARSGSIAHHVLAERIGHAHTVDVERIVVNTGRERAERCGPHAVVSLGHLQRFSRHEPRQLAARDLHFARLRRFEEQRHPTVVMKLRRNERGFVLGEDFAGQHQRESKQRQNQTAHGNPFITN
jgi:hypothetical protein